MNKEETNQTMVVQTIEGVEALVNINPGEIFIDIQASNPRYIRVQEGDLVQEGDVRTRTSEEMMGPRLTQWRIESISTDTVIGTNIDTGDPQEWEREWLVQRLGGGEFSVELTTFDRVSVTVIDEEQEKHPVEDMKKPKPHVVVVVYGNDGEKFTQFFAATEPKNWDSLEVVQQDELIQNFSEELRGRFDDAIYKALKIEQRYQ